MSPLVAPATGRRLPLLWGAGLVSLGLASAAAQASDVSIGAGLGLAHGQTDCVEAYACDHRSTHAKLTLGIRLAPQVQLQALVFDAGHLDGGDTSPSGTPFGGRFGVRGAGLALGYRWDLAPDWSLTGQLGLASVRTRFAYAAPFAGEVARTSTQPLAGLSLAWAVAPNWQLCLDHDDTRFKVHTRRGALRLLGVTAQHTF